MWATIESLLIFSDPDGLLAAHGERDLTGYCLISSNGPLTVICLSRCMAYIAALPSYKLSHNKPTCGQMKRKSRNLI